MKLIIDIPEEDYKFIKDLQSLIIGGRGNCKTIQKNVINAIKNGTPVTDHSLEIAQKSIELGRSLGRTEERVASKRSHGKWFDYVEDSLLKARHGKHVIYNVDYLLDNLAREVAIMETVRQMRGGAE